MGLHSTCPVAPAATSEEHSSDALSSTLQFKAVMYKLYYSTVQQKFCKCNLKLCKTVREMQCKCCTTVQGSSTNATLSCNPHIPHNASATPIQSIGSWDDHDDDKDDDEDDDEYDDKYDDEDDHKNDDKDDAEYDDEDHNK